MSVFYTLKSLIRGRDLTRKEFLAIFEADNIISRVFEITPKKKNGFDLPEFGKFLNHRAIQTVIFIRIVDVDVNGMIINDGMISQNEMNKIMTRIFSTEANIDLKTFKQELVNETNLKKIYDRLPTNDDLLKSLNILMKFLDDIGKNAEEKAAKEFSYEAMVKKSINQES